MNDHSLQNTEEEPIQPWNDRSHTRRTQEVASIAGRSHTYTEKQKMMKPTNPNAHTQDNKPPES